MYKEFIGDTHHIKFHTKRCGVFHKLDNGLWEVQLMVMKENLHEDGNPNCNWRWVNLKQKHDSLQDAKLWLNSNIEQVISQYVLRFWNQ